MAHTFHLVEQQEKVGALTLSMTGIRDFDEAVDDLYEDLASRGEGEQLVELCPFFAKLWPAARGLSRYLEAEGKIDDSSRILEVGCGLALPGLVASMLGGRVTVSDFHEQVPLFLARNVAANRLANVPYLKADWRNPATALGEFDLVIGSDVLYDRSHAADLVRFVQRHLAPGGRVVISDPGRAYLQEFTTRLEAAGFTARIETMRVPDGEGTKDVFIVDFRV